MSMLLEPCLSVWFASPTQALGHLVVWGICRTFIFVVQEGTCRLFHPKRGFLLSFIRLRSYCSFFVLWHRLLLLWLLNNVYVYIIFVIPCMDMRYRVRSICISMVFFSVCCVFVSCYLGCILLLLKPSLWKHYLSCSASHQFHFAMFLGFYSMLSFLG